MKLARWQRWLLLIIAVGGALWFYDRWRTWREDSQDDVIRLAAAQYGVEAALIKAVVWRESRFDPGARGSKGELGLMQIMESTAKDWASADHRLLVFHSEMLDRRKNTQCGAWYLRRLLGRYNQTDNRMAYALADYNAGRGNVLKWMQGPAATNSAVFLETMPFPGTREYVRAILERRERYVEQFAPKK
jgi:soluble lytic murein transglycosylase